MMNSVEPPFIVDGSEYSTGYSHTENVGIITFKTYPEMNYMYTDVNCFTDLTPTNPSKES